VNEVQMNTAVKVTIISNYPFTGQWLL